MNKKKQVDAVIDAVGHVLGPRFKEGLKVKAHIGPNDKQRICQHVYDAIVEGSVVYNKPLSSDDDLKKLQKYVRGMVGNHLNRSPILNGGQGKIKNQKEENNVEPMCIDTLIIPPSVNDLLKKQ